MLSDELLELQRIDTTIDQLTHRRAHLPERAAFAGAEAALGAVTARGEAIRVRVADLDATIGRLEHDGTALTTQRDRLQGQLKTVIAPREAEALLHEIDTLRVRRNELDEQELAHLEEQGALEVESASLAERSPVLHAAVVERQGVLDDAERVIDDEVAALRSARAGAAAAIEAPMLARYDALRQRMGGIAVARLEGTHCSGCHLDLSRGEVDEVKSADGLADCPQCGRLLVV